MPFVLPGICAQPIRVCAWLVCSSLVHTTYVWDAKMIWETIGCTLKKKESELAKPAMDDIVGGELNNGNATPPFHSG